MQRAPGCGNAISAMRSQFADIRLHRHREADFVLTPYRTGKPRSNLRIHAHQQIANAAASQEKKDFAPLFLEY